MCHGIIGFKSNGRVIQFLKKSLENVAKIGDDQISLNQLALSSGFQKDESKNNSVFLKDFVFGYYLTISPFLRFAILSLESFPRDCSNYMKGSHTVAMHCLSSKSAIQKLKMLKKYDLWKVEHL